MKKILIALTVLALFAGCGSKEPTTAVYLREGIDLAYVSKIAVLPFENLSSREKSGQRVRDIAITELLASGKFEVTDKGIVDVTLREMAINPNTNEIDAPLLKILGKRLGVNAFLTGTVNNIEGGQGASLSYPEISLTLHLIDADSAQVLWRSTSYRNGYSIWNRLFDLDPKDEFEITLSLLQDMVATIPK